MREEFVIKIVGKDRWKEFQKFMIGQTVSSYPDGSIDYYECDVNNFLRKPKNRFFD